MVRGLLAKLLGNDGVMKSYLTIADPHTVVMAYSKEQLTRGVEHVRSGAAGLEVDEHIANTDKLLPAGRSGPPMSARKGSSSGLTWCSSSFPT